MSFYDQPAALDSHHSKFQKGPQILLLCLSIQIQQEQTQDVQIENGRCLCELCVKILFSSHLASELMYPQNCLLWSTKPFQLQIQVRRAVLLSIVRSIWPKYRTVRQDRCYSYVTRYIHSTLFRELESPRGYAFWESLLLSCDAKSNGLKTLSSTDTSVVLSSLTCLEGDCW